VIRSARQNLLLNELVRESRLGHAAINAVLCRISGPRRHYHGLAHIAELWGQHRHLSRGTAFRAQPTHRLIAAAILFHDTVYDPHRTDNEARSARLWRRHAGVSRRLPRGDIERVATTIEATATHAAGHEAEDYDQLVQWVLDLDLSSIGAPRQRFRHNSSSLRAEFVFVPAAEWRRRNISFFQALDHRPKIYHTRRIGAAFEAAARANLTKELRRGAQPENTTRSIGEVRPATSR
jgi:predicted metal-dependent HD superfamily phosphohydrolase